MKNNNGEILIGGAVIFKEGRGKNHFLLSKNNEGEWEILKSTVRRGESSVRAVIRFTSEQGNMNTRVLDEVGRGTGAGTVGNKSVTFKYIYYLMLYKTGAEIMGIGEHAWFDYAGSLKKLKLKREKDMLKTANGMIKEWEKKRKSSKRPNS
ncbi:MAG: hypothetical protein UR39_C0005G0010 [Candidatus Woesebacteria bacterium GW2011_GWA1_33_30]|uniref:Uncharacterized protein n=1 Tax=Candidatus Woesebacteria bacterium GW2011_GWA2_33_28 TaxID=1618561 RepID=A0A0G0CV95_9BACT|nr:MAG: hypothetical protein UR38_C0005G0010 [Candidatus Woesebacteria bacterium GW2011_GWA2_33_28]KKP48128.1 MAG: hypothetical protein UR39_C0005G0010 [Candidatus Woesebacteria bacterium GW2011_GWA1_33_30]KKP49370.1 MAG: hypothetical protein UR40_C0006G0010 [Microgenomates group bacterium GW2011_GWC1_33_32]KKP52096.1 MAG: hypothetical protein UR44_C0004G0010 [Candidatus Woesebacteria bacterium GW2011_GWB1_33_38]